MISSVWDACNITFVTCVGLDDMSMMLYAFKTLDIFSYYIAPCYRYLAIWQLSLQKKKKEMEIENMFQVSIYILSI